MDLGKAGNSDTMIKLFCELMPHGWRLIREGWREGLPKNKPPKWTFCPLLKFPRDRKLVEECKKCPHFKGVSHSLERGKQQKNTIPFKVRMTPAKKRSPKKSFSQEQLEQAIREKEEEDRKFWEEEEKLQKKWKESDK